MVNLGKKKPKFSFGETFTNPWLGNKTTEVLDAKGKRAGWIWTHSDGTVVISPHLGFYIWYGENGKKWTKETGALWLVQFRRI